MNYRTHPLGLHPLPNLGCQFRVGFLDNIGVTLQSGTGRNGKYVTGFFRPGL